LGLIVLIVIERHWEGMDASAPILLTHRRVQQEDAVPLDTDMLKNFNR